MASDGGKGDSMRPTDKHAFDNNLERVFGVKKPWYIIRDEQAKQEQSNEHRQAEVGQASTADER